MMLALQPLCSAPVFPAVPHEAVVRHPQVQLHDLACKLAIVRLDRQRQVLLVMQALPERCRRVEVARTMIGMSIIVSRIERNRGDPEASSSA